MRKRHVALLGLAACEAIEAIASRLLTNTSGDGPVTVVVLGFRNEDPTRPNWINRWRVRMALRTAERYGSDTRLLVCGGDPAGVGVPEADILARHARELGFVGPIDAERESRTTWENAVALAGLLTDAPRVALATNPLHGLKARIYLASIDPSLRGRFVRSDDTRPGEMFWAKPLAVVVGLGDLARVATRLREGAQG